MQPITPSHTQTNALPANPLGLKDIHVPEQITNYPIAYGWWVLAALLLIIIVMAALKIKQSKKRNQIKKQALSKLKSAPELSNSELFSLLKWAAIHYFSRVELAKLYGDSLQQFLLQQLPEKHKLIFTELSEQAFKNQYQANSTNEVDTKFHQATQLWLSQALPPKSDKHTKNINTKQKLSQRSKGTST